ncbi:MAG: MBL fold metallo-hydrolase [Clostridiales bacterium]|nr:MBL fold metallo-hydrolase [Clostridiales bacterium]
MKAIDFSCKHDILIRHKDGTLTPMDEPYYEPKLIAPNTWQIMSSGDYHYLLVGDEEGITIDTGYGAGNLREYLESLCGKPVRWAVNTHHHFDHTANNCYFDLVYMAEESVDLAAVPYPSFDGITFPRDYAVQVVDDGYIIPLKGRELEVFKIGDHTDGGIAILDRKARLLFAGDEIMPGGKPISNTVEKLLRDTEKLMKHRDEFDLVCSGPDTMDPEVVDITYEACQRILAGERTPEAKNKRRGMPHRKPEPEGGPKIYDCQHPHPEDVHNGKPRMSMEDQEIFSYRGREFTFQESKVFDKPETPKE